MESNSQKKIIRQEILARRLALSAEEVNNLSVQIENRILKNPVWKKSEKIGLYSSVKNEVETNLLFMKALEEGMSVYFPRVEQGIRFYEIRDPGDLEKGAWGILEPKHDCAPLLSDQKLDLLMVPGIAFDKKGYRLGYGRGFYDHVLEEYHDVSVGLAYEFQVKDELPLDVWDKKVARVVTEKNDYLVS